MFADEIRAGGPAVCARYGPGLLRIGTQFRASIVFPGVSLI
jgi:hypothetical protein